MRSFDTSCDTMTPEVVEAMRTLSQDAKVLFGTGGNGGEGEAIEAAADAANIADATDGEDDEGEEGDDPAGGDERAAEDALARLADGLHRVRVVRGLAVFVREVVARVPLAEVREHEEDAREHGVDDADCRRRENRFRTVQGTG